MAAYRTDSLSAVIVVSGVPPIDPLVWERTEVLEQGREVRTRCRRLRRSEDDSS